MSKLKILFLSLLMVALPSIVYFIYATVPFGSYILIPDKDKNGVAGEFSYNVPLDPKSPWPKFRANELQNGRTSVDPVVKENLKPWEFKTGKGIFSSPVVDSEGTVYVGSADHFFYAIDKTGKLKWKFPTGEIIDSSALLDNKGRVYFGSGDGHVYCLKRSNGEKLWDFKADTTAEVKEKFDIKTFNVNWFEGNISILKDGTLLAPNDNYLVYAIDREKGVRRTQYFGNEMIWSVPAVNTNTDEIFFGTCFMAAKNIFSYNTKTNLKSWTTGGLGTNAASILLTSNHPKGALIVGGFDGYLRAFAQENGKELWKFGARDHIYSSPAQQKDGAIIQPSADGTVYSVNPLNGKINWAFDTLEPIRSSPAIDNNGIIYVGSGEGKLYAINPDGKMRWAYQLIQEDRNDINSSPALGFDGVYVAGENGGIFFIPYDFPLTQSGKKDAKSFVNQKEALPDEGDFLLFTTRFGSLLTKAPEEIDANEPLTFTLFIRRKGDTVLSAIDSESTKVSVSNGHKPLFNVSADKRFLTIIPQEKWTSAPGENISIQIEGSFKTDLSRFGLKFFGGKKSGSFKTSFQFKISPRTEATNPIRFPKNQKEPSTVYEISRQSVPNPTMLPSWNQIGFDSLHYLLGMVEGNDTTAVVWVVPGKFDEKTNRTVVDPALRDCFPLNLDYDGGLITLTNYDGFKISFIGTWDMPFGLYRLSSKVNPKTGEPLRSAALNAVALGDEIEFYGKFLKLMGMTDFKTGLLHAYGGLNLSKWGNGLVNPPNGIGNPRISIGKNSAVLEVTDGNIRKAEHVFSLLIINALTSKPVPANYARATTVEASQDGRVNKVILDLPNGLAKGNYRVYYMVDAYPAFHQKIEVK